MGILLVTDPTGVQTMPLGDIITEICQRVNDPFKDNYSDRARDLFIASVYQQISDPKYTRFDYQGVINAASFSTGSSNIVSLSVDKINNQVREGHLIVNIIDIVSDNLSEDNSQTRKFVRIDLSEANRIATDTELEPIFGEVYWYFVGNVLYFHPSPTEDMRQLVFLIEYMANPQTWKEDEDMLGFYSVAYIYDAIDMATGKLLAEIGLS